MNSPQMTEAPAGPPRDMKMKSHRRAKIIAAALIGLLVAGLATIVVRRHLRVEKQLAGSAASVARITVEVITVKRDTKPHHLTLPGDIQPYASTTLFARTNGYIKAWYTDIGAKTKNGDLMAEIEAPDLDAQLSQAVASVAQARANLEIARLTNMREKDLLDKQVVAQQDYDQTRTTMEAQDAALKAGEANLQDLQAQKNFQRIIAPFAGVVTRRFIDVGALVTTGNSSTGTMLFSIEQTDPLRIFTFVPQADALEIRTGMDVKISVQEYPGRDFDGAVTRTAGAIDPVSRTLLTEVDIPNPDGTLYAGMYGQVKFVLEQKMPPILLPANAFAFRTAGPQVAEVTKENRIHWQDVKVGRDFGTALEIPSGLEENTMVVVNPTDDLREGMSVLVKPATSGP